MKALIPLLLFAALCSAADNPAPDFCDAGSIPAGVKRKASKPDSSGRKWTVLVMGSGYGLCTYGDRYVVIKEQLQQLQAVVFDGKFIILKIKNQSGDYAYVIKESDILSGVEKFRGAAAQTLCLAKITYKDGAFSKPSELYVKADGNFSGNMNILPSNIKTAFNGFMNSGKLEKISQWVMKTVSSNEGAVAEDCSPAVKIKPGVNVVEMICRNADSKGFKSVPLKLN